MWLLPMIRCFPPSSALSLLSSNALSFFLYFTHEIPEDVIISVIHLVNPIVIPAISHPCLLTNCLSYLAAVAEWFSCR